ncbi:hypothetical protein D3C81_1582260 [compost metagenome]
MIMPGNAERIILNAAHMTDEVVNSILAMGQAPGNEPLMLKQEEPGLPLAERISDHEFHPDLIYYYHYTEQTFSAQASKNP